jgi:hypothetical protein
VYYTVLLQLLPYHISSIGYVFALHKLVAAMAKSKFYPIGSLPLFGERISIDYLALYLTGIVTLIYMAIYIFMIEDLFYIVYIIGIYATIVSQIANFISYTIFAKKYGSLQREFTSPIGVYGAYYGIFVFAVLFIAGLMNTRHYIVCLVSFFGVIGVLTIYYHLKVQHLQAFSQEEETILFLAHVMKGKDSNRLTF